RTLSEELWRTERQLRDAMLNNEALARVVGQMQEEQEALERKWQRECLGRKLVERKLTSTHDSVASIAAEADARVAAREAAQVLQRQADLLLATQEHRMRVMNLRLDSMHEQLGSVCSLAHSLADDAPAPLDQTDSEAHTPADSPLCAPEWAECLPGGLCLESTSLWVAPDGATHPGAGVHGRRAAVFTDAWSEGRRGALDPMSSWWALSPEGRDRWWAEHAGATALPGCVAIQTSSIPLDENRLLSCCKHAPSSYLKV
ncbi:MAG: hypothetical protein SGPRY_013569, partial [Prymnesium sp.]